MKKNSLIGLLMALGFIMSLGIFAQDVEKNDSVPQVPFGEFDSLVVRSVYDRYCVAWKDGKCGVYDFDKDENVTRLEYSHLQYAFRREFEGKFFTYFAWEEEKTVGVLGISEATNTFITVSMQSKSNGEESQPNR